MGRDFFLEEEHRRINQFLAMRERAEKAEAEVVELTKDIKILTDRLHDCRDMLAEIEWGHEDGEPNTCPSCGRGRCFGKHTPDCSLAALLAKLEDG
jgi:hypothetical protein